MTDRSSKLFGVVVAAGTGSRFGGMKQFARLCGRPVLLHSLVTFDACPGLTGFIVVAPRRRLADVHRLVRKAHLKRLLDIVAGGQTRTDSVRLGLDRLPATGYVAIHDAARPAVTVRMLRAGFAEVRRRGPVTYGRPVTDTLKTCSGQRIRTTIERHGVIAVQTPQFFPVALIKHAHAVAAADKLTAPDDCALLERLNIPVRWLEGPADNIKITTRADLRLAERLLCADRS